MHVVIYFGVESRSQTANSDINLVCNLYWWRILKSKLNFCEVTKALHLFCPKKIPKFFPISICQINVDNPDFSFNCRLSTFCFTKSDSYGSRIREQKRRRLKENIQRKKSYPMFLLGTKCWPLQMLRHLIKYMREFIHKLTKGSRVNCCI